MPEEKPKNEDGSPKEPTPDTNYDAMRINKTIEEGKAEAAAVDAVTPEALGVDQASFDKFFKDGDFDWSSYGKEQAFKAQQKASGADGDKKSDDKTDEKRESKAPQSSETQEAKSVVDKAGLDWNALGSKIEEAGDIDPEDYEALKGIGIPDNVVKGYVESVKKDAQGLIDEVIQKSGGQDTFDKVWDALQEKPIALRNNIDALIADPATRDDGIELMFKQSGVARPSADDTPTEENPALKSGGPNNRTASSGGSSEGYASFEEQVAAQRDPRYKSDVSYRNEVMKRISASTYDMNPRTHTGGL